MGVNWDSGVLFWKDHEPNATERYTLSHLHPFQQKLELAAVGKHPARNVDLYVAFGLHTFTRKTKTDDGRHELYRDNRETRTFCQIRYRHSFELPRIIRTLETRRCEFARGVSGLMNYVTLEMADGARYAAFFELRRLRTLAPNAVQLMVQSAYILDRDKPAPGKGRIHFHALLGHVVRGTTPQPPP